MPMLSSKDMNLALVLSRFRWTSA